MASKIQTLFDLIDQHILTGGRRTLAAGLRMVLKAMVTASVVDEGTPYTPDQFDGDFKLEITTDRRVAYVLYRGWPIYNVYHYDSQTSQTKVIIQLDEEPDSDVIVAFY